MASRNAAAQAALGKLVAVLQDREGLSELSALFSELDTDGNGTIDYEEFVTHLMTNVTHRHF